jgi:TM2 domain-containing membrane protein YozV
MKSKGTAYLLLIFLGVIGAHRFYLGKTGTGILYLCTLGFCGVGVIIDLFTLGNQVDVYNALHGAGNSQQE